MEGQTVQKQIALGKGKGGRWYVWGNSPCLSMAIAVVILADLATPVVTVVTAGLLEKQSQTVSLCFNKEVGQ